MNAGEAEAGNEACPNDRHLGAPVIERLVLRLWILLVCAGPTLAFAQIAEEPKPLHWWEIVSGMLAIPVTLVGLAYSYVLIKKTGIESRKNEIEIRKIELEVKEKTLALAGSDKSTAAMLAPISELADVSVRSQAGNLIVIRFVFFLLILILINFAGILLRLVGGLVLLSVMAVTQNNFETLDSSFERLPEPVMITLAITLQHWQDIFYALVTLWFGLPILRDAGRLLGISAPSGGSRPGNWLRALRQARRNMGTPSP